MLASDAIEAALALYRQPALKAKMAQAPLPSGITDVLRIAASPIEDVEVMARAIGSDARELIAASVLYLQTVLFHNHAGDARLMGLHEDATAVQLRDHKRLILKWLHPDRNRNSWETKLFKRALDASERLELRFSTGQAIETAISITQSTGMRHPQTHWLRAQRRKKDSLTFSELLSNLKNKFLMTMLVVGLVGTIAIAFNFVPQSYLMFDEVED
jgi:hypothetical protein